jgi:hypothetical protein
MERVGGTARVRGTSNSSVIVAKIKTNADFTDSPTRKKRFAHLVPKEVFESSIVNQKGLFLENCTHNLRVSTKFMAILPER